MAVRRETVVLSLSDQFSSKMARAAAQTAKLNAELERLDGRRVSNEFDGVSRSTDRVGQSARRAGPDIDKFSGRFRLMADAALTLGTTLVPLGAATIPVLTGALAGLGAAAGGITATVLAFQGMGDALEAIDKARLEPTAENLQAMRVELEKLGPAGADFARYLDSLGPAIDDLQNTARAGLFPGLEDGIDDLLTRLPQVQRIVGNLATAMGDLAAEAGEGLASDRFTAFFDYIESDAQPTLEAFGRSTGYVAEGIANLLVAFAPLSRDFTGGLEDATRAFAEWSRGLDDNQSFQAFVAYIRESGPQAVEALSAIAQAFAALIHAAAPFGSAVLPIISKLAQVFAAVANSPIGPGLYTAAAAMIAFNRASSIGTRAFSGLEGGLKRLGAETKTTSDKLALFGARGGVVLAGAVAVGALADSINRIDTENLDRSLTALQLGNVTGTVDKVVDSIEQLNAPENSVDLGKILSLDNTLFTSSLTKFADNIDQVDQKLAQLVESGQAAEAADVFKKISDLASARGVSPETTAKQFDAYRLALDNAAGSAGNAAALNELLGGSLKRVTDAERDAADGAQEFSDALAGLNGWLDKREALRAYRDGLKGLTKGLHDGFGRKDVDNIDAVGRSITQVASLIKDRGLRADFLEGAKKSLQELANESTPKAKREIQELIDALDRYGLTKPKSPKLDADDKPAREKVDNLKQYFRDLVGKPYTAKIEADGGQALSAAARVAAALLGIHDRTVYVNVVTRNLRGGVTSGFGGHSSETDSADGGTVPKSGKPYADRYRYLLADGEEVISNRYGQADRHRSLLKAINANRMADGGTTGGGGSSPFNPGGGAFFILGDAAEGATRGLKGLKSQLEKSEKALDRERSKLESLTSSRDSLSSSTTSSLLHDPFGNGLAGFNAQVEADANDSQAMLSALQTLVRNGLDPKGALFQALAASGDLNTAQQMATLTSQQLFAEQSSFNQAHATAGQVGAFAGQQAFGQAIAEQRDATKELRAEVKHLRQEINQMGKHVKDGAHDGSFEGTKAGQDGRNQHTASFVRTGGRR